MYALTLAPDQDSYNLGFADTRKATSSGLPVGIYAKGRTGGKVVKVNLTWTLSLDEYRKFSEFYKETVTLCKPFRMQLFLSDLFKFEEFVCYFKQDSFNFVSQSMDTIKVSGTIEAALY